MKKPILRSYRETFAAAGVILLCLMNTNCKHEARAGAEASDPAAAKVEEVQKQNIVVAAHPEQFALSTVGERRAVDELKVTGVVAADVDRTVPVLSLAGGRVVDTHARLGDEVKKGQVLLLINSPDVSMAFSDAKKAQADELFARRQLDRSRLLFSRGAIAAKDLEAAEDAEQKAKTDVETATEHLRVLGSDPAHPSPVVEVRAPISGVIIEQNVTGGTGVRSMDNSPNLFTIADLSKVWVLCDVYENNLAQVHLGDFAEVRLNAYPDRTLRGRVSNVARVLDPATRTAKVRLELDNRSRLLRTGMFATAVFRSPRTELRPVAPATAVLRLHDKDWVFRPEGEGRFRRTEIQAGPATDDGMLQILSGLSPGDKVVTNALEFSNATEAEQ
jgi:cobalt-zinc-cadmium efflux system membrane fusion protein